MQKNFGYFGGYLYYENDEVLKKQYEILSKNEANLKQISGRKFEATINTEENGYVIFTIPYNKGFKAIVDGKDAEIINIHTIKPLDKAAVVDSVKKTGAVITVENHNVIGGLKSAVCEVLMEECPVPLRCIGVKDKFGQVGKMPYLKEQYEMRSEDIVEKALEVLSLKNR